MEKKELKFYEEPEMELLYVNVEGFFCASSDEFVDSDAEELHF